MSDINSNQPIDPQGSEQQSTDTTQPTNTPSPPNTPATVPPPAQDQTNQSVLLTNNKKSKRNLLIGLLVIVVIVIAGVGVLLNHHHSTNKSGKQDIALIRYGIDNNPLNAFYPSNAATQGPSEIQPQIFDGLVTFRNGTQIVPDLATSWTNPR